MGWRADRTQLGNEVAALAGDEVVLENHRGY
jgi:hypothetical protein